MKRMVGALFAAVALVSASCGSNETSTETSPTTTKIPNARELGETVEFMDAAGALLGAVAFHEVVTLPPACVGPIAAGNAQGTLLAARVEMASGTVEMAPPNASTLRINDADGYTDGVESAKVDCGDSFPEAVTAPVGGKSRGWIYFMSGHADPSALVFTPVFGTGSIFEPETLKFIAATPATVIVELPKLSVASVSPQPTPTTTPAPEPEQEPTQTIEMVPDPVIVACDYPAYANTEYSDGTRGQTDYCAAELQNRADAERAANTPVCDGTFCRYPSGATMPDPNTPKKPPPWVQGQLDWQACKEEGNTDEACRQQLNDN